MNKKQTLIQQLINGVLVLAVIAINETAGAVLFRRALMAAGEMPPEPRVSSEVANVDVSPVTARADEETPRAVPG